MVMVAEVTEQPVAVKRHADGAAAGSRAQGPRRAGTHGTPSGLEAGVRSLLGSDAREFLERQWQPFGE